MKNETLTPEFTLSTSAALWIAPSTFSNALQPRKLKFCSSFLPRLCFRPPSLRTHFRPLESFRPPSASQDGKKFQLPNNKRTSNKPRDTLQASDTHNHPSRFRPNISLFENDIDDNSDNVFSWYDQWYPVGFIHDMSKTHPNRASLLGIQIVIWWSRSTSSWTVFHDKCPHRRAALSEGRINPDTGDLECGYHGWQFRASGRCSVIPQADNNGFVLPPRATCVSPLPTCIEADLLFAWMGESSPPSNKLPASISHDTRSNHVVSTFSRTLPISFTTLLQNVLDPAHIHFAHHGQIGRREWAQPIDIHMTSKVLQDGFSAEYYSGRVHVRFRPPSLVEILTVEGRAFAYYAVPISPCTTRTFAISAMERSPLLQRFRPAWIDHLRRNIVLEGDLALLMSQRGASWSDYVLPTQSDTLVVALASWLRRYAPVGYSWYEDNGLHNNRIDESKVMSRKDGHLKECNRCATAVKRIETIRSFATFLTAMLIIIRTLDVPLPMDKELILMFLLIIVGCEQCKKFF